MTDFSMIGNFKSIHMRSCVFVIHIVCEAVMGGSGTMVVSNTNQT